MAAKAFVALVANISAVVGLGFGRPIRWRPSTVGKGHGAARGSGKLSDSSPRVLRFIRARYEGCAELQFCMTEPDVTNLDVEWFHHTSSDSFYYAVVTGSLAPRNQDAKTW